LLKLGRVFKISSASSMLFQLILQVQARELALEVYFKNEDLGERWLKSHYLLISQLVFVLAGTRDFDVTIRRIR